MTPPRATVLLARAAVAIVWLYNGLWLKLVSVSPEHRAVVESLPLPAGTAAFFLAGIGVVETVLALWVLSGRCPQRAAIAQTLLLVAMNGGGLIFGGSAIERPVAMIVQNLALVALIWLLAGSEREEE
jgi:uncharacterized membrane protein YphA (DoxX/SURF4 family)